MHTCVFCRRATITGMGASSYARQETTELTEHIQIDDVHKCVEWIRAIPVNASAAAYKHRISVCYGAKCASIFPRMSRRACVCLSANVYVLYFT